MFKAVLLRFKAVLLLPLPPLQLLDGPYIAFVASVKLEGAYLAISQRDVEAEAEAARLKQLQEEQEEEDEAEEREQEVDVEEGDRQPR